MVGDSRFLMMDKKIKNNFKRRNKGFSLIEIIIVITIIGIISGISIEVYDNLRERSFDREAIAALRMLAAAERQYYARMEFFWPNWIIVSNHTHIKGNLSVNLPDPATLWNYDVASTLSDFRVRASRLSRTWTFNNTLTDPVCTGTCF